MADAAFKFLALLSFLIAVVATMPGQAGTETSSVAAGQSDSGPFPPPPPRHEVRLEKSVMVKMRDGVGRSTDIYFPEGAGDRLPVIRLRTPYNKNALRVQSAAAQQRGRRVPRPSVRDHLAHHE